MSRQMKFVAFLMAGPTCHHHAMWRHPESENRFFDPAFWETLARTLEVGKFDGLFFTDTLSFYNETIMARGGQMSLLDPVPLVAIMARATSRIGLGVTISTSPQEPYSIARLLSSLDVLSGGRIAWNIVTSANDLGAQDFGNEARPPRGERYDLAEEVLKISRAMWAGWADGALVVDKESGMFIDERKVSRTEIAGKLVGVRGMFAVPPSPQRHPVIMQAATSPGGRKFAASYAELVFTLERSLPNMQEFYADMKDRTDKAGRNPDDCAILISVDPIIGETESIAREKQAYINEMVDAHLGIALVSAHTGLDLSRYPADKRIDEIPTENGSGGSIDVILKGTEGINLTLGEAAKRFATSELCPQVVGTPQSVADQLQELFEKKGCDGFIVSPTEMPGSFETFTRSVVPILQKRGVFRKEYPGSTLRETIKA
ncbi:LLM class flavin-dependent oxidoreductase [Rhizobium lentis]|uniref:FMN-dependent oxidoreductase (Nitrilotriacetate monooxygenase family) n=1 Tax=Rhizobium lentis TaxID=1138194 RepID=A0A7W8XLD2_9HYPH|nr:LLM class flavin-dependent oxidoreductase [Rhizobium lentis]MBB4577678.1 FMN-dependent oxidoreductase (nitrilotriacetate monooxygenase family) [Rhizobium lentis]MBB5554240.1 FMN-dependent oxidoreductase (nitrilotriacetate monooxygenase family) [Rhizobium lentis]MBB5564874.1 FMN-dependent oxidoreductase (nitrilotriacetate monooxygenase family) [Rhizobium lentis]MBB5571384.1 FMN-dependent oxidoreductase (nitrilotriacetate monooxygenase family) [Rhizobium lentis]